MEPILEVARERAADSLSEGSNKKQISPAILTLIVDVAMQVIQGCMQNNTAQGILDASKNEFLARLSIRRAMRQMGEKPNEQIISSVLAMAKKSNAQEVEQLNDSANAWSQ